MTLDLGRLAKATVRLSSASLAEAIDRCVSPRVRSEDGALITGFWRSGTTWLLQEWASRRVAKSIFEPFHPRAGRYVSATRVADSLESSERALTMPFADSHESVDPDLVEVIERSLKAKIGGPWVRRARRSILEAPRRRVVVKLVLGQLCAGALAERFGVEHVHLWRDPRAVAASLQRGSWWRGWLDGVALRRLLLDPEDGRRRFFVRYEALIDDFDRRDALERVVSLWCLTELFLEREGAAMRASRTALNYEEIASDPAALDRALGGKARVSQGASPTPSPTTARGRVALTAAQRLLGWREELKASEREAIEGVVRAFELEERLL